MARHNRSAYVARSNGSQTDAVICNWKELKRAWFSFLSHSNLYFCDWVTFKSKLDSTVDTIPRHLFARFDSDLTAPFSLPLYVKSKCQISLLQTLIHHSTFSPLKNETNESKALPFSWPRAKKLWSFLNSRAVNRWYLANRFEIIDCKFAHFLVLIYRHSLKRKEVDLQAIPTQGVWPSADALE